MKSKNIGLMHKQFPLPESQKTVWPWTTAPQAPPATLPNGSPWPRISIVTPSLNQGEFLEETIRSVLLQGYPNLEYIIIDGGSTDNSLEIIHKYEPWLAHWVSEPDRGQGHAINKGFAEVTGDIIAWINSDDYYAANALTHIGIQANKHSESLWFAGKCLYISDGRITLSRDKPAEKLHTWLYSSRYGQPSVFFRKILWDSSNQIDESIQNSFDYDLWLQFAQIQPFATWVDEELSYFRIHPTSKTVNNHTGFIQEDAYLKEKYRTHFVQDKNWWKIKFKHQERIADIYLSNINEIDRSLKNQIIKPVLSAPWYLLKRRYYVRTLDLIKIRLKKFINPGGTNLHK